jgi:hypothetical protein
LGQYFPLPQHVAPEGAQVPSSHILFEPVHVGHPSCVLAHHPLFGQHTVPPGQHEPAHPMAQTQRPAPPWQVPFCAQVWSPQQKPVDGSYEVNAELCGVSRGQQVVSTQSDPSGHALVGSPLQHEVPGRRHAVMPSLQHSKPPLQAKSSQHTAPVSKPTSPQQTVPGT